jgi:ABC-2 type transport system ATP-binding protein
MNAATLERTPDLQLGSHSIGRANAVRFENVSMTFGHVHALERVNFHIKAGETVALLGPNGAGKSTAISIMLGLLHATAGVSEVFGVDPQHAVESGRVGAMLQTGALLSGVSVRELVNFVRKLYPKPMAEAELFERANLASIADRKTQALSGGEAQRVRFAFAIAGNPDMVFLDEPTVAMDVDSRRDFWSNMRQFAASGRTVLFATHYLEEADAIADRIIVLNHGKIVADGSATEIKSTVNTRVIRFTLPDAEAATLQTLTGATDVQIHGHSVELQSSDADQTVRALVRSGLGWRDLEVQGADIEDAFLALTRD